jgi:hypothetical protein
VGASLQAVVGYPGLPGFTQGQIPTTQELATPIPLREPAGQELLRNSDAQADYGSAEGGKERCPADVQRVFGVPLNACLRHAGHRACDQRPDARQQHAESGHMSQQRPPESADQPAVVWCVARKSLSPRLL